MSEKTTVSSNPSTEYSRRGPVETSLLEYVLFVHGAGVQRRATLISLLIHAELLARGARPVDSNGTPSAVLDSSVLDGDPIRLSYTLISRPKSGALSTPCSQLQVSVAETDAHLFVNLTDSTTDKFGHLELSGLEHVRLGCDDQCKSGDVHSIFPQFTQLLEAIEEKLWKPVLPSPPLHRTTDSERLKEKKDHQPNPEDIVVQPQRPAYTDVRKPVPLADYGRSDLDPFGPPMGMLPGRSGPGSGMLLDPRHLMSGSGSGSAFFGGPDVLPPGAVPPGARFDPMGPGISPVRPGLGGRRPRGPDPDHALPPGFEDMYM